MESGKRDYLAASLVGLIAGPLSLTILLRLWPGISWPVPVFTFPLLTLTGIFAGRLIGRPGGGLRRFVRFGEIGGLNWLMDLGALNILVLLSGESAGWKSVAWKAISFTLAVINSYLWNRAWVFRDAPNQEGPRLAGKFIVASVMGLGVNLAAFAFLGFIGSLFDRSVSALAWLDVSAIAASMLSMAFNYFSYKTWVFRGAKGTLGNGP